MEEAREKLTRMNLTGAPFSAQLPTAQLHWIIADKDGCIVVESMADGLHVYDNPAGVLTNNPPFPQQMFLMNQYMNLSPKQPENLFSDKLPLTTYSRGRVPWDCLEICHPLPVLPEWHYQTQFPV